MMDANQFASMLKIIVPAIIERFMKERGVSCDIATERLYNSTLYEALEDQDTALWHLSPLLLCDMLMEELDTGKITMPEEQ